MTVMKSAPAAQAATGADDAELVRRAPARDGTAFRTIMERYNRRLYRIARGILRNDSEAEDVVQEAYVSAFAHLQDFRGDSSLATWLSRRRACRCRGATKRRSDHSIPPHRGIRGPGTDDGATANPAAGRTGDRQPARNVPHRVRHPRHRGDERGGNRRPPRLAAGDGENAAAPRPAAGPRATGQADRPGHDGRVSIRRPALPTRHHGGDAAARASCLISGNFLTRHPSIK